MSFSKVMPPFCNTKDNMFDYCWYFSCKSNISGLRLWLMALMLNYGTLQNVLQSSHVFGNFTFICKLYSTKWKLYSTKWLRTNHIFYFSFYLFIYLFYFILFFFCFTLEYPCTIFMFIWAEEPFSVLVFS